jgi:GET complex subunit GET2
MMLGFDPSAMGGAPPSGNPNPFAGIPGMDGMGDMGGMSGPGDDPMMKMMQQIMGGIPGEGPGGMPSFPGMPGAPAEQAADPYAYLWRIIHAVFALGLGLYIALTTTFSGTKIERERSGLAFAESGVSAASVHFFWIFATVEVLLQSSRFMMEKGRSQQAGIVGMIMGFLPEPYKGYLALVMRYSRIWTTVSGDAMVCVFVLGVCAWLRGN